MGYLLFVCLFVGFLYYNYIGAEKKGTALGFEAIITTVGLQDS